MASAKAVKAAQSVNSLLHLSSGDQQSLLEVIQDYFTTPCETNDYESDSDSDDDIEDKESSNESGTNMQSTTK